MKHDFDNAQRGPVIQGAGKTRVTMYLDDDVIEFFRGRASARGRGYQTEINATLRGAMGGDNHALVVSEASNMAELKSQVGELVRVVGRIEKRVAVGPYPSQVARKRVMVREAPPKSGRAIRKTAKGGTKAG